MAVATKKKDPATVALGRKGGKKGRMARAAKLTPEQRSESARKAVRARWAKFKAEKSTLATLPPIPAVGDHSKNAIHALVEHIKVSNDKTELEKLMNQLNHVICRTHF